MSWKQLSEKEKTAMSIAGRGPSGCLNYAYADGYAFVAFKKEYGEDPSEVANRVNRSHDHADAGSRP